MPDLKKVGGITEIDGIVRIEETIPRYREELGKDGEAVQVRFTEHRVYRKEDVEVTVNGEPKTVEKFQLKSTHATYDDALPAALALL